MQINDDNSNILRNKYIPTAEFYSQIIDSLQDYSIFTLDIDLNINSWSSGSTKIFGYETQEVIGKSFDLIFTEEDLKNAVAKREIQTALKEGRATAIDGISPKKRVCFMLTGWYSRLLD